MDNFDPNKTPKKQVLSAQIDLSKFEKATEDEKRQQDVMSQSTSFFKDGMRKADPVLLEPIMKVEVETPEEKMGDVMGDLSSRRGMIQGMDDLVGGGKAIRCEVPLAEMFGYSTTLRSLTQGRATYVMEFGHYAEAPKNVAEAVIEEKKK